MNIKIRYKDTYAIINTKGAELKELNASGVDYFWNSDPKYWGRSAPLLFPVIGTCKDKKATIDGVTYEMPKHGIVRDLEFDVVKQEENMVELSVLYSEETLKYYPFKFKLVVTYILDEKLTTSVKVVNVGDKKMAFNFGGHPAFMCPVFAGEVFEDYKITFEKEETFVSPKVESNATLNFNVGVMECESLKVLELNKGLFNIDTIIITNVKSDYVTLTNRQNKGIKFEFSDFSTLSIWTPKNDAPFICLEPWIGYNDRHDTNGDFYTKDDLMYLESNEEKELSYSIEIIK